VIVEITQIPEQHIALVSFLEALKNNGNITVHGFRSSLSVSSPLAGSAHQFGLWLAGLYRGSQAFMLLLIGIKSLVVPVIGAHRGNARKISDQFFDSAPNKGNIESFQLGGIEIGDLIYDAYLRQSGEGTINPKSSKFRDFFEKSISLFLAWQEYFLRHEVSVFIGSNVYLQAIPQRIAVARGIQTFDVQGNRIHRITRLAPMFSEFQNLLENFHRSTSSQAKASLSSLAQRLERIKQGKGDFAAHLPPNDVNEANFVISQDVSRGLVAFVPSLGDSPHTAGRQAFVDPIDWFSFLCELTERKDLKLIYKVHPISPNDGKTLAKIARGFDQVREVPLGVKSSELLDMRPGVVLSIRGHVALEAGLRGIPVALAGENNPYISFGFASCAKNPEEYELQILNLLCAPPVENETISKATLAMSVIDACYPDDIIIPDYRRTVSEHKSLGQHWKIYDSAWRAISPTRRRENNDLIVRFLRSHARRLSHIGLE
jgi:hypothetical protein